jgi:hypothetical protein
MAKNIVCTFAFNQSLGSNKEVAKVLGVDRRNIKKGLERRTMVDTSQNAFWMDYKRAKRSNSLSERSKKLVVDWWKTKTTISLNQKDITRLKIKEKQFEMHLIHYLQTSEVDFFSLHIYSFVMFLLLGFQY